MLIDVQNYPAKSGKLETRCQLFGPMIPDAFYLVICLCFLDRHAMLSWKGLTRSYPLHNLLCSKNAVVELRMHCPTRTIMPISLCQFTRFYT